MLIHAKIVVRRTLVALGVCVLAAAGVGCSEFGGWNSRETPTLGKAGANPEQVQSELMAFTDTFISAITQQWNQADAGSRAPAAAAGAVAQPSAKVVATPGAAVVKSAADRGRRASLEIKLSNVAGALAIASSPNSMVGLADMITMISLERMILEDPWAVETFGPEKAARVVAVYKEHEAKAWRIADRVFTPKQKDELKTLIAQWRKDHPDQRYIAGVRLEDFAADRGTVNIAEQSSPGSLLSLVGLDPLANLDPTVREVQRSRLMAERIFFYSQHAPLIVKWQTESLYTGFLQTPEVKQAMAALADVSDASNNVAEAADLLRKDLGKERHEALTDLFGQFAKERQEAMDQFFKGLAVERANTLKEIDDAQGKIGGTLVQARETIAATQALSESLKGTIQAADALAARVLPPPTPPSTTASGDTGPKKDVLAEYRAAADQTSRVVEKLTELADRVDKLLASQSTNGSAASVQTAVAQVQGSFQKTIDRMFWWMLALALIAALSLGMAIAFGLSGHKAMERRSAAKRRHSRRAA